MRRRNLLLVIIGAALYITAFAYSLYYYKNVYLPKAYPHGMPAKEIKRPFFLNL